MCGDGSVCRGGVTICWDDVGYAMVLEASGAGAVVDRMELAGFMLCPWAPPSLRYRQLEQAVVLLGEGLCSWQVVVPHFLDQQLVAVHRCQYGSWCPFPCP
jgi:hypothetical protein